MIQGLLFLVICLVIFYEFYPSLQKKTDNDVFWEKWDRHKYNFPLTYKGRKIWYGRTVATVLLAFTKNEKNEWCVLANLRGEGCPDYQGYWNLICGYLEFSSMPNKDNPHLGTGEYNCVKECYEECGIKIPIENIKAIGVSTTPYENKQNVSIRYITFLDKIMKVEETKFDLSHSEKNEVVEAKWIPITEIDNYEWAFHHDRLIKNVIEQQNLLEYE